jgi:hypothetical protein
LGFVDWQNPLDGLQFHDHFIVNNKIYFVSAIQLQSLIRDRKIDLAFEGQAAKMQFMAQALLVCGFQQSGPELTVYFDGCANDRSSSRVLLVFDFSVPL